MTIHKEGHKLLLILLLITLIINGVVFYFCPQCTGVKWSICGASILFYLTILQFFRSPTRVVAINDNHIIAPADGKIVVIEEVTENEFLNEKRIQISIFMSPVNVHINRNPISGIVKYFKYHEGKYLVAWHPKASTENERTSIVLENSKKQSILMRQIAGALAKRIIWYIKETQEVKQGEEFGFIKFGSRVDVFVPLNAKINVKLGQKSIGGKTILAEFN